MKVCYNQFKTKVPMIDVATQNPTNRMDRWAAMLGRDKGLQHGARVDLQP